MLIEAIIDYRVCKDFNCRRGGACEAIRRLKRDEERLLKRDGHHNVFDDSLDLTNFIDRIVNDECREIDVVKTFLSYWYWLDMPDLPEYINDLQTQRQN